MANVKELEVEGANIWPVKDIKAREQIDQLNESMDTLEDDMTEYFTTHNVFTRGTDLTSGTDLDELTTFGRYNIPNSSIAGSLNNTPYSGAGFALFVFPSGGATVQLAMSGGSSTSSAFSYMMLRICSSSGVWGSWYAFSAARQD